MRKGFAFACLPGILTKNSQNALLILPEFSQQITPIINVF